MVNTIRNNLLGDIEPREVFGYFEDLSKIPRESGNEKEATDFLISFAKVNGLEWNRDEYLNVLIRKKASRGYEERPTIILQAHSDMVCEKNSQTNHDFLIDPIKLLIDGDKITADGTTLGADDGIGVAFALALLADEKAEHPGIEFVCTSDEERGMIGVENFDVDLLKGRILINLDANDEGVFVVGCAGGPAVRTEIPLERETANSNFIPVKIEVRGLKGGHSGEDIHRGRANSNKLMIRILTAIKRETDIQLVNLSGGLKYNAIPREADALILVDADAVHNIEDLAAKMGVIFQYEYKLTDENISVSVNFLNEDEKENIGELKPITGTSTTALMNYIDFAETGIIRMQFEIEDTVESSISMGVVTTENERVVIQTLVRSSVESIYMEMYYKIQRLAESFGGVTVLMSNCPEWEYNPESKLKTVFEETFKRMYSKNPKMSILHAGLECGVFGKKMHHPVDMIAVGPDMKDLHTPGEWVSISSTARFWEFFKEVIKNIK